MTMPATTLHCPPCHGHCDQGRTCPARCARTPSSQPTARGLHAGHVLEAVAALAGLLGAALLASNTGWAPFGWLAFLASNAAWIAFGYIGRHRWLVAQQVGFTATSLWGIYTWLRPLWGHP